jgi:hypothetical protein
MMKLQLLFIGLTYPYFMYGSTGYRWGADDCTAFPPSLSPPSSPLPLHHLPVLHGPHHPSLVNPPPHTHTRNIHTPCFCIGPCILHHPLPSPPSCWSCQGTVIVVVKARCLARLLPSVSQVASVPAQPPSQGALTALHHARALQRRVSSTQLYSSRLVQPKVLPHRDISISICGWYLICLRLNPEGGVAFCTCRPA